MTGDAGRKRTEGLKRRHIGDPTAPAQAEARPRVLVSRCLLGHRVRYDGRDKHQPALAALLDRWRLLAICPELEAGLGVPRPPMDLVGPPGAARPIERASGRDLEPLMTPAIARLTADIHDAGGLDGAVLKARSPSCGLGSAARYDRVDDPAPAARVDGVFAAALRGLRPAPRLIDEGQLADPEQRARFALAVELRRRALNAARWGDVRGLDGVWRAWHAGPLAEALRAAKLDRKRMHHLADDPNALVGHIDAVVECLPARRLPATPAAGVHQTIGS